MTVRPAASGNDEPEGESPETLSFYLNGTDVWITEGKRPVVNHEPF